MPASRSPEVAAARLLPGAITPRVGGVGPTTVGTLFQNAITAAERASRQR